jgi:hypothetical protein
LSSDLLSQITPKPDGYQNRATTDMTLFDRRKRLLQEKLDIDFKANQLEIQIKEAQQIARARHQYTPIGVLAGWRSNLAQYKRKSQEIQNQLIDIKRELANGYQRQLSEVFMDIARAQLEETEFTSIIRQAKNKIKIANEGLSL